MSRSVDPTFLALPLDRLADAALAVAKQRGATHADFRIERLRNQVIVARDRELQTSVETESVGFSVRVVCKGAWGFAAGVDLTAEAVVAVARRAIEVAESLARLNTEPVTLADEPVYTDTYVFGTRSIRLRSPRTRRSISCLASTTVCFSRSSSIV